MITFFRKFSVSRSTAFSTFAVLFVVLACSVDVRAQVPPNVLPELEQAESAEMVYKIQELAWNNYEQNRVAEHFVDRATANLRSTRLEWFDALNLSYTYYPDQLQQVGAPEIYSRFGIGLSLNIGRIARTPSRIRMASIDRNIAKDELELQRKSINNEVMQRWAAFIASSELYQLMVEAVENGQSTVELVRERFANGELSVEELQRAEEYLIMDRQRLINARTDFFRNRFSVEELIGVPIETLFQ